VQTASSRYRSWPLFFGPGLLSKFLRCLRTHVRRGTCVTISSCRSPVLAGECRACIRPRSRRGSLCSRWPSPLRRDQLQQLGDSGPNLASAVFVPRLAGAAIVARDASAVVGAWPASGAASVVPAGSAGARRSTSRCRPRHVRIRSRRVRSWCFGRCRAGSEAERGATTRPQRVRGRRRACR